MSLPANDGGTQDLPLRCYPCAHDFGHRCRQYAPQVGLAHEYRAIRSAGRRASRRQAGHLDHRFVRFRPETQPRVGVKRRGTTDGKDADPAVEEKISREHRVRHRSPGVSRTHQWLSRSHAVGRGPLAGADRRMDASQIGSMRGGCGNGGKGGWRRHQWAAPWRHSSLPAST